MIKEQNENILLPLSSELRIIEAHSGRFVFVVDGSRFYEIDEDTASIISTALSNEDLSIDDAVAIKSLFIPSDDTRRYIHSSALAPLPLYSLSLNVAQACNMACRYCYADEGKFGSTSKLMPEVVAFQAVDRLIEESAKESTILIGFMGGEPLLNRSLVHNVTKYATKAAADAGRKVRFSITTNGTLLTKEDVLLFHEFPYTVQISLDGDKNKNDEVRVYHNGKGTYDDVISKQKLFQVFGRPHTLSARVTITPLSGELLPILDHLIDAGFDDVGFSPVLVSPDPSCAFSSADFDIFLQRMIKCAEKASIEFMTGRSYPFSNFLTALREIHKGTHRPYPCGAGATYLSVNTQGSLYACHRLVDDPKFAMGNVFTGSDVDARTALLSKSHVDNIEPCKRCWARYLCGGGCYHEVSRRGRIGCDFIRGWLQFCLGSYATISMKSPELFLEQ